MPNDPASLDRAFAALKTFDYGGDAAALAPIDQAVVANHGDAAAQGDLERRLVAVLAEKPSHAALEYVCRKLSLIGTAASVPVLAPLLTDEERSHVARLALQRIPAPEAAAAIRGTLEKVDGDLAIGMIASLAARRDVAAVPLLTPLLSAIPRKAVAAADALGRIHSPEAVRALESFATGADASLPAEVRAAVVDARLSSAEALLGEGRPSDALALYRSLAAAAAGRPADKWIELAATRGIAVCLESPPAGSAS
jgi:hypothetical protein